MASAILVLRMSLSPGEAMRKAFVIAALSLGACATPSMESALAPLAGQPVQVAIERLGTPSSALPSGADTVYEWHQARMVRGAPSGTFNGAAAPPSPDAPTSGLFPGPPVPYTCDVRIVADPDGNIKDAQFSEQSRGCSGTAEKLSRLALAEAR
jgi:hypothetical protein